MDNFTLKQSKNQFNSTQDDGGTHRLDVRKPERSGGGLGGLSKAHISPQGSVNFWPGGSRMTYQKPKVSLSSRHVCGQRGQVTEFSRASRRRLLYKISELRRAALPVFVTLTYPGVYPQDSKEWKRQLDNFFKRLKRHFPRISAIWKLEPQLRGAPHFHLLVWGAEYYQLLGFCAFNWYEVVGSGDERHLRAGTRVERVRSWRGVMAYAAKYLGKVTDTQGWASPGRFWGVFAKADLPWAEVVRLAVSDREAYKLLRLMRRFAGMKNRYYSSLTIFCSPEFWLSRINELL